MDIHDATKLGFTPLYEADQRGCFDTVQFLLDLYYKLLNSELDR